jgi:hypothetical protein
MGAGATVTVYGASSTGGGIYCNNCNLGNGNTFLIDASTSATNQNGGNVTLAAYNGSAPNAGKVDLSFGTVNTSATSGKPGNVTVIAPSITLKNVFINGTTGGQ